jgi:hypothetical protein
MLSCQLLVLMQHPGSLSTFQRYNAWVDIQAAAAVKLLPVLAPTSDNLVGDLAVPEQEFVPCTLDLRIRFVLLMLLQRLTGCCQPTATPGASNL